MVIDIGDCLWACVADLITIGPVSYLGINYFQISREGPEDSLNATDSRTLAMVISEV
jgi:hypothetical protein